MMRQWFRQRTGLRAFFCICLCACLALGGLGALQATADVPTTLGTGSCGDALTWSVDSNYMLHIQGTGALPDYQMISGMYNSGPWHSITGLVDTGTLTSRIVSLDLGKGLTRIGSYSFAGLRNVGSVYIPEGVTSIGDYAFYSNFRMVCAYIPNTVTQIGRGAFAKNHLLSVSIPSSVTSIGADAFQDFPSEGKIYYAGTAEQWKAIGGESACSATTRVVFNSKMPLADMYYYPQNPKLVITGVVDAQAMAYEGGMVWVYSILPDGMCAYIQAGKDGIVTQNRYSASMNADGVIKKGGFNYAFNNDGSSWTYHTFDIGFKNMYFVDIFAVDGGPDYTICLHIVEDISQKPTQTDTPSPTPTPTTTPDPNATVGSFTDVAGDAWYAESVSWAVARGITNGTTATTFSPDATCSKAQILTFLYRASGSPDVTIANPFVDVQNETEFYYKPALWAYEMGIIDGNVFNPDEPCTRASTVTYLWKYAGAPQAGTTNFADVPINASYAKAVAWAVDHGITKGTGTNTFSPDDICTRGHIVTFLYRTALVL